MSDKQNRQRPVYVYLAILFTVAIVLTLYSFLMTHRNSQQILRELKDNNNILQSTLQENNDLEARVEELEVELSQAQQALTETEKVADHYCEKFFKNAATVTALDWLREIEREYSAGHRKTAQDLILAFEDNGLPPALPTDTLFVGHPGSTEQVEIQPAAERYTAIVEALFPNGLVS